MSARIGHSAWVRPHPFLLYYQPTSRCDARCGICTRWQRHASGSATEELELGQVELALRAFYRAGAQVLTLWGGEPLLRRDLPEILKQARGMGLRTAMCSNCNTLARRAEAVLPHLDTLLCSLDGHGATHDELRGVRGLFDRVVSGIRAATAHPGCRVKIWAAVNTHSLGQVEDLASLARELGAGIEFFPISAILGYNDDLVPSPEALREAFGEIRRLKARGYPIANPDRVLGIMQRGSPFRCNFGRIAIQLDPQGTVCTCEDSGGSPHHIWGHVAELDLDRLYRSEAFSQVAEKLSRCNECRLPCVVQLSGNLLRSLAGMFFARQ